MKETARERERARGRARESVQTSRVSTKMNETTEITITTITFKRRGPQLKKLQVPNNKSEGERETERGGKRGRHTCICICN